MKRLIAAVLTLTLLSVPAAAVDTLYDDAIVIQAPSACLMEKATGQVFGSISLYNSLLGEPAQRNEWPGFDLSEGIWEPGYCIGQKWWGKGFTTEALQAVVDFWFNQVGGTFLTCCHAVQNPASGRVMEKAGFVYHHNDVYHKFDGTPVECRCYLLTKNTTITERTYFERAL